MMKHSCFLIAFESQNMQDEKTIVLSKRRRPKQARSTQLVEDILTAAAHVLREQGAHRFTTARVAERAGVSIGSVYQYFPNKNALLFRLQSDEWVQTSTMLRSILQDPAQLPLDRLRIAIQTFVSSEKAETDLRKALSQAAPLYGDTAEARQLLADGHAMVGSFVEEMLPKASPEKHRLAVGILAIFFEKIAESICDRADTEDVNLYSDAMADMICGYFSKLMYEGF